jgi:hypothetical protein
MPSRMFFPYIGDYVRLLAVGREFYGVFAGSNTPDMANFPSGVAYQRKADWTTHTLFNVDGTTPVQTSIDPFFFRWTETIIPRGPITRGPITRGPIVPRGPITPPGPIIWGCWWGERSHCTFCGLNGATMAFRSKTPERVLSEIKFLCERYGVATFSVVDGILDMRYFRSVLPRLAEARLGIEFFWEVKANLDHRHVRQLRAAGVRFIQPGIESLSDHVSPTCIHSSDRS